MALRFGEGDGEPSVPTRGILVEWRDGVLPEFRLRLGAEDMAQKMLWAAGYTTQDAAQAERIHIGAKHCTIIMFLIIRFFL